MPERIPLDPPPGDPDALDDLVRQVSGAVFCLGVLESSLCGPAGSVPGWVGRDATAAAVRVDAVTAVARDGAGALWTAAGRLAAHRDRLLEARDRIRALAPSRTRTTAPPGAGSPSCPTSSTALRIASPAAVAVVEDFAAAEAMRAPGARRAPGGGGRRRDGDRPRARRVQRRRRRDRSPGDAGRAVAYLAVALPEWGAVELAARGSSSPADCSARRRRRSATLWPPAPGATRETVLSLAPSSRSWVRTASSSCS